MCVSFPVPPDYDGNGKQPGAVKLFLGAVAFLVVMLVAYLFSLWRGEAGS